MIVDMINLRSPFFTRYEENLKETWTNIKSKSIVTNDIN